MQVAALVSSVVAVYPPPSCRLDITTSSSCTSYICIMISIPLDVVCIIVAELACMRGATPDVRRCALVCRSWGHVCQAELFQSLNLGDDAGEDSPLSLPRLIYILLHPHLAALVRMVTFATWARATRIDEPRELSWWIPRTLKHVSMVRLAGTNMNEDMVLPKHALTFLAMRHPHIFFPLPCRWTMVRDQWENVRVRTLGLCGEAITPLVFDAIIHTSSALFLWKIRIQVTALATFTHMNAALPSLTVLRELTIDALYLAREIEHIERFQRADTSCMSAPWMHMRRVWRTESILDPDKYVDVALPGTLGLSALFLYLPPTAAAMHLVQAILRNGKLSSLRTLFLQVASLKRQDDVPIFNPFARAHEHPLRAVVPRSISSRLLSCEVALKKVAKIACRDDFLALFSLQDRPQVLYAHLRGVRVSL